jgi:hypothetical protein
MIAIFLAFAAQMRYTARNPEAIPGKVDTGFLSGIATKPRNMSGSSIS